MGKFEPGVFCLSFRDIFSLFFSHLVLPPGSSSTQGSVSGVGGVPVGGVPTLNQSTASAQVIHPSVAAALGVDTPHSAATGRTTGKLGSGRLNSYALVDQ